MPIIGVGDASVTLPKIRQMLRAVRISWIGIGGDHRSLGSAQPIPRLRLTAWLSTRRISVSRRAPRNDQAREQFADSPHQGEIGVVGDRH
jgi:hypothetical protein